MTPRLSPAQRAALAVLLAHGTAAPSVRTVASEPIATIANNVIPGLAALGLVEGVPGRSRVMLTPSGRDCAEALEGT